MIQIACGDDHCLALTKGGQLYSWGDNQYGQLGNGPAVGKKVSVPSPIGKSNFYFKTSPIDDDDQLHTRSMV